MPMPSERRVELPLLQARLASTLSLADDALFLRMLWTLNALQTGREQEAARFLNGYPPDAATEGILGGSAIYPWELETLANELLTTPKHLHYRMFNCRSWNEIGALINQLREVENAEYGARRDKQSVLVEMGRIGARQFPWQRGHFGISQLYRNAFVYGQGECAAYLNQSLGLTSADMTLVGFSLLSVFNPDPAIRPHSDLQLLLEWGVDRSTLFKVIDRISCPLDHLRSNAASLRAVDNVTAYKPSVLRQYPCILTGHKNRIMLAPIPDLIMDRVTNGLFYDVIGGGGPVREEIGQQFECYSVSLLREMLVGMRFESEVAYRTRLGPVATPDIRMFDSSGALRLAIECKASRMSVAARFGDTPEGDRGYEEIAKGVMQLWRFFSHCRKKVSSDGLAVDFQGMVLTLDEWFAGRSTIIPQIIMRAHELADTNAHAISREDRRPVAFCTISELEDVLRTATPESLLETVQIGSGERVGWIFPVLHEDSKAEKAAPRAFPFEEALSRLLPWYSDVINLTEQ